MLCHNGNKIGLESAHSFGDCLFNLPLIKAISLKHGVRPTVAVRAPYRDAFYNVPFINDIMIIDNWWDGINRFESMNYNIIHQLTQNHRFEEYKRTNPEHSLAETALCFGRSLGIEFDHRPMFFPTEDELSKAQAFINNIRKPIIAIEGIARSGQSWIDRHAVGLIIERYHESHSILWLSHEGKPDDHVIDMSPLTRRETICALRYANIFYSAGSGFFCSSMAIVPPHQPKRIVVMWRDETYKYEKHINMCKWHDDIVWTHNHEELVRSWQR